MKAAGVAKLYRLHQQYFPLADLFLSLNHGLVFARPLPTGTHPRNAPASSDMRFLFTSPTNDGGMLQRIGRNHFSQSLLPYYEQRDGHRQTVGRPGSPSSIQVTLTQLHSIAKEKLGTYDPSGHWDVQLNKKTNVRLQSQRSQLQNMDSGNLLYTNPFLEGIFMEEVIWNNHLAESLKFHFDLWVVAHIMIIHQTRIQ